VLNSGQGGPSRPSRSKTLYTWIGAFAQTNDYRLYEKLKERLSEEDATMVMTLFARRPSEAAAANPDTLPDVDREF